MKSFLTGSQVYGKPRNGSDIDLVVLVSESDGDILKRMSDDPSFRKVTYGQLNLIVLNAEDSEDVAKYNIWKDGTEKLIARKPVTREEAIRLFDKIGLTKDEDY